MAELFLIRHAQASFGAENYDKLSELGHSQARWLGEYLAQQNFEFDHVMLGNMVRHRETLDGLHLGLKQHPEFNELDKKILDAEIFTNLNEFDFRAVAEGFLKLHPEIKPDKNAKRSEFYRIFKMAILAWSQGEIDDHVPEKFSEFRGRVVEFVDHLKQEHVGRKILAVTSGGAIGMAISHMLGANEESMIELNIQIRNTSISHCFFNQKRARLHTFNHVPHLENTGKKEYITYS